MTLEEAIKYFGSGHKMAINLGIKPQNVTRWKKQGYIPQSQQYRIEKLTKGALKADEESFIENPVLKTYIVPKGKK